MARLLGDAYISILPKVDIPVFRRNAERQIDEALAGVKANAKVGIDTKGLGAKLKAKLEEASKEAGPLKTKVDLNSSQMKQATNDILAAQSRIAKAREADAKKEMSDRDKITRMYKSMFDQISKDDATKARIEAANAKAREAQVAAIAKRETAAAKARAKEIEAAGKADAKAAAKRLSDVDAVKSAQDRAWTTYGRNLLASEKLDAERASKRIAQEKAFESYARNIKVGIRLDEAKAEGDVAVLMTKLRILMEDKLHIKPKVSEGEAEAEAIGLKEKLKLIFRHDIKQKVKVDRNYFARGLTDLLGLATRGGEKIGGALGNTMSKTGKATFGKAFAQAPLITTAILAALAGLPAAIGAIGAAAGVALGAGIIFGAVKFLKTNQTKLQSSLNTYRGNVSSTGNSIISKQQQISSAKATIAQYSGGAAVSPTTLASRNLSISNTQATITRLSNAKKLTAAQNQQLKSARARLVIQKQQLANSGQLTASQQKSLATAQKNLPVYQKQLSQLQNQNKAAKGHLKTTQQQLNQTNKQLRAYAPVMRAFHGLEQAFLKFASIATKPFIKPLHDALLYMGKQLVKLAPLFANLFKQSAPLIKPFVDMLVNLVKTVLPPMAHMLHVAGGEIGGIIRKLGTSVGTQLGRWFKEAIPYIKSSGHYISNLLKFLGDLGVLAIKVGGMAAKAFDKLAPVLAPLWANVQKLSMSMFKALLPAIVMLLPPIIKLTNLFVAMLIPIANWLAENPKITAFIIAILAIQKVFGVVKLATVLIKTLGVAFKIARVAALLFMENPWVAAVAGLVIAAVLIYKNWGPISKFFIKIGKDIYNDFIKPVVNWFKNSLPHAFGLVINWLKKYWPIIVPIIFGPMGLVITLIIKNWNKIFGVLKTIWNGIFKAAKFYWNLIFDSVKYPILIIVGIIGEAWIGIKKLTALVWPYIFNFLKSSWDKIANAASRAFHIIWSKVTYYWGVIKKDTAKVWDWIWKNILGPIWNALKVAAKDSFGWIANKISWAWDEVRKATSKAWNWIWKNILGPIWGTLKTAANDSFTWIRDRISGIWNRTRDITKGVWNDILGFFKNTIWKGLKNGFKDVVGAIGRFWDGLKNVVKVPVEFVLNKIYDPFASFINKGLSIFGVKSKLPRAPKGGFKFASGGHVPGYAPGSDTVPAMLSPGEFVINPTAAKKFGYENLRAINEEKVGGNIRTQRGGIEQMVNGGQLLASAEKWKGHKYVWGGGANPRTGWDCSSFMSYILATNGISPPAGFHAPSLQHGPVAAQFRYGRPIGWGDGKKGDLAVEKNGGHVTMLAQDGTAPGNSEKSYQAFGALSTQLGTGYQTIYPGQFDFFRVADDRGLLGQLAGVAAGVLKTPARLALEGIQKLMNNTLGRLPGPKGVFKDLVTKAPQSLIQAAINKLQNNAGNYIAQYGAYSGPVGGGPAGGATGSATANAAEGLAYLAQNVFGGGPAAARAAAGAVASIYGESGWNPFAQGTGGRGLIGWTPPSSISNTAFRGGMKTQLPAIVRFISSSGDWGVIAKMKAAAFRNASLNSLAQMWGKGVERYGINDVHPAGLQLASMLLKQNMSGGTNTGSKTIAAHTAKKHMNGGSINEPVYGFGALSGMPYSFGERGRRERVVTEGQSASAYAPGMQPMSEKTGRELVCLLKDVAKSGRETAKGVTGAGRTFR